MSAHFYCWEPSLSIDPRSPLFEQQLRDAQAVKRKPAQQLLDFVGRLLAKHPDLTETDATPWADGPMKNNITGSFINFSVSWSWYDESLITFVVVSAASTGLHCFDPQTSKFYRYQG